MQHPDEGVIHTWLDGELPAEDAAALEAHVADCAQCAAAVAEARGLIAASSRIVSALDSVPGGVIPGVRPTRRAWYSTTQFRAAAALLLVAGTSLVVIRKSAHEGDRAMLVVPAPRIVATDAISPEASTSVLSKNAAVTKPAAPSATSAKSSNSAIAAAALSAPVAAEKRRATEPAVASRPFSSLAAAPQTAEKSAASRPAVQDSMATAGIGGESVVGGNELELIRTDTMREMTQRTFATANGAQLIMTERGNSFGSVAQSTSARTLSAPPKQSAVRNAPKVSAEAKDQVKFSDYRTITWVDPASGRSFSLTGPFPPDQLEKFKTLVIKLSK
jgi:hypothetical protein